MAAFCGCCGAEISDRAEACPVCGTPRHGILPPGIPRSLAEEPCPVCIPEVLPSSQAGVTAPEAGQAPRRIPADGPNKVS
jgi:hypothetical protein